MAVAVVAVVVVVVVVVVVLSCSGETSHRIQTLSHIFKVN